MRKFFALAIAILFLVPAGAQTVWHDPLTEGDEPYVQGRAWNKEIGQNYHRFPDRAKDVVRPPVWNLSLCSSGLLIDFYTNSANLTIQYNVTNGKNATNIPTFAKSGIDVYRVDKDGVQYWLSSFGHYNFGKTADDPIIWSFNNLSPSEKDYGDEYRVYLPMYCEVENLKIGVDEGAVFKFAPNRIERPIVAYGTSIAMGASPSRPAMSWTNILHRRLDMPIVNLAFSGNGKLEKEIFELLGEIDAKAYILDCLPNMGGQKDSILPRTIAGVKYLRSKNSAPIILTDIVWYGYANPGNAQVINSKQKETFEELKRLGFKDIYYVTSEDLGIIQDDYADGSHPNDIGMTKYADAYEKVLAEALDMHPLAQFHPIRQRRDIRTYDWAFRHNAVLERNRTVNPQIVLIGDSITHFWDGFPECVKQGGKQSWKKLFGNKVVTNMGYGWDRIENFAWRMYNGELDDCSPEHIFLLLGINNAGLNTNSDIADGVVWTVKQLRKRQPQAKIHVQLVYPCRNKEKQVAEINSMLMERLPKDNMIDTINLTDALLLKDGTGKIDESLFTDGLHPNEEGYKRIAKLLKTVL